MIDIILSALGSFTSLGSSDLDIEVIRCACILLILAVVFCLYILSLFFKKILK